jgi:L-lactate dehydrogenase (cytochrome)
VLAGTVEKVVTEITNQEKERMKRVEARPPLSEVLNLHDFEVRVLHLVQPAILTPFY